MSASKDIDPQKQIAELEAELNRLRSTIETMKSEEKACSTAFENVEFGICFISPSHEIIAANPSYIRMFGEEGQALAGRKCHWALRRKTSPCADCPGVRAMTTGKPQEIEFQIHPKLPDEPETWFRLAAFPIKGKDGATSGYVEVVEDVSARKTAEQKLAESEELYRCLVEVAFEGIAITEKAKILHADNKFSAMFGYESSELIGKHVSELVHPDHRKLVSEKIKTEFEGCYETLCTTKNGKSFPVEVCGKTFFYKGRRARLAAVRDISIQEESRKQLRESEERYRSLFNGAAEGILVADVKEKTFIHANAAICRTLGYSEKELLKLTVRDIHPKEHLDHVLSEFEAQARGEKLIANDLPILKKDGSTGWVDIATTLIRIDGRDCNVGFFTDISEKKKRLEEQKRLEAKVRQAQKLESLGVLAGGIAHDFNNLLVGVLGNADLARLSLPRESPAREYLEKVAKAANQAAELTNQMLAYAGKGKFAVAPTNLNQIIIEMTSLLNTVISKNTMLRFNLEKTLNPIEADPSQIRQVVMNLIINASEALNGELGTVKVDTGEIHLDQRRQILDYSNEPLPQGAYVFIQVSDTGVGMDEDAKMKIFDPFFTTKFTGRGLGMASVQGIVRGHKGFICLKSDIGKGSEFKLFFPLPTQSGSASTTTPLPFPAKKPSRPRGAILIIDDDEMVRNVAMEILKTEGFSVVGAKDGIEGISIFRQRESHISAVILDMTMPGLNGEETLREIRKFNPDIPVIMSSGYQEEDAMNRLDAPPAAFIQKPYRCSNLIDKLEQVLAPVEKAKSPGD